MIKTIAQSNELLVRADIYRVLSKGFSYPSLQNLRFVEVVSKLLIDKEELPIEIKDSFSDLLKISVHSNSIVSEYSRLFLKGNVSMSEGVYVQRENSIADVSAFYQAFGVKAISGEVPDSLPYELEFAALMLVKMAVAETDEQFAVTSDAYKKFFNEHLYDFSLKFYEKMFGIETIGYYVTMCGLLIKHLNLEGKHLLNLTNIGHYE